MESADTFSDPADWRGRRVHLFGDSLHDQDDVIQALTQSTRTGEPPADTVGLDGNGDTAIRRHITYQSGNCPAVTGTDQIGLAGARGLIRGNAA